MAIEKKHQFNLGYILLAFWAVILFQNLFGPASRQLSISYSEFESYLEQSRISSVAIDDQYIRGEFSSPVDGNTTFITPRLDTELAEQLAAYDVEYTGVIPNTFFATLLSWVAPALVFVLAWFFLFRRFAEKQGMGGLMNIGNTRTKVRVETDTGVRFKDVAGVDEAREELMEVVRFLKEPENYRRLGAHIPKGVLLIGPPGTGKTLIARAVAGEAGVPFFSISGSEFIELFVGVGAARVRDLFNQARKEAPAIIFIDELDALGRTRAFGSITGGHDEREQTLNQLLAEMDGFSPAEGVIILAATNRPEILDPALLRAGRFDRQVLIDRPDKNGREQILQVHARKIQIDPSLQLKDIAALTTGFSGADLANLVNEAAIIATRRNAETVTIDDFVNAIERIVAGLEHHKRLINPAEKNIVAHHESGHALVSMLLQPDDAVQKVSVIPRGIGALGYTIQRPSEDRNLMTRRELENRIAILLAGRAAEDLVFSEVTTGAADDLAKATDIARSMVLQYGMSEIVGLQSLESTRPRFLDQSGPKSHEDYGPDMQARINTAVEDILDHAYTRAREILFKNEKILREISALLLSEETLNEQQLVQFKKQLSDPQDE